MKSKIYKLKKDEIGKDLKTSPKSEGEALTYSANINYPILRNAIRSLLILGGFENKSMYNETTGVETSDKSIYNLKTSLIFQNIDKIYLGGYMQGIITYTNGDLDLSGSSSDYNTDQ